MGWKQYIREKYPNSREFFEIFAEVHKEINQDVIENAEATMVALGLESAFAKVLPTRGVILYALAASTMLTSGKHAINAIKGLTSSEPEVYDFSVLAYQDVPTMFHDSLTKSTKSHKAAYAEIGDSVETLQQKMIDVIIDENSSFSEETMQAFEDAIIALPAQQLIKSLEVELNKQHIANPEDRARYLHALGTVVEEELDLTQKQNEASSSSNNKYLNTARSVLKKEVGVNKRLRNLRSSIKNINQDTKDVSKSLSITSKESKKQKINFEVALSGFQFLQMLGTLTEKPNLQRAGVIGEGSYKIIAEIVKLNGLAIAGTLSLAPFLSSLTVIGMAGSVIIKLLKKKPEGPDPQQLFIMKQLHALSQQMESFRQDMLQLFIQTHKNQRMIYDAVCDGINLLYFALEANTADLRYAIISKVEDIQSHLHYLEERIGDGFQQLGTQPLLKTISSIERKYNKYTKNGLIQLSPSNFQELIDELAFWLISHERINAQSKSALLTGATVLPLGEELLEPNHYKRVINLLSGEIPKLGQALGFLIPYAQRYLLSDINARNKLNAFQHPVNIELWSYAVDAYVKLRILAYHADIPYDENQHELNTLFQDAEKILQMSDMLQELHVPILTKLLEHYNESIASLKSAFREKINLMIAKELAEIGTAATKLSLQSITMDIFGEVVSLNDATIDNVSLPKELVLAQRAGLGKLIFMGDRSERIPGSVVRHSDHGLGVSAVYPSARYTIDVYFEFTNNEQRIYVTTGSIYIPGAQEHTNPGKRQFAHIANANYARGIATLGTWNAKSDAEFFTTMWNQNYPITFTDVAVDVQNQVSQLNLEKAISKEELPQIYTSDRAREVYLKLDFFNALINAYIILVGSVDENLHATLSLVKSGRSISALLQDPKRISQYTNGETVDEILDAITSLPDENALMRYEEKNTSPPRSPLMYPVIEQITALSTLLSMDELTMELSSEDCGNSKSEKSWGEFFHNALKFPGAEAMSLSPPEQFSAIAFARIFPLSTVLTPENSNERPRHITTDNTALASSDAFVPEQKILDVVKEISMHPQTNAPLFIFHAFDKGHSVGNMTLYGHSVICRSEDGLRHNIIDRQGVFTDILIDPSQLIEVCTDLPPDADTLRYQAMQHSAMHGALRGSVNVMEKALQQQGVDRNTTQHAGKILYYGCYYLLSFMQHYTNDVFVEDEEYSHIISSAIDASYDLLKLCFVTKLCSSVSASSHQAAKYCAETGWTKTARAFSFLGRHIPKLIYAESLIQQGIGNTALNVVSGASVQHTVEYIGERSLQWSKK